MRLFVAISFLLFSQLVFGVNRDWVGGVGDWNVAANWNPAGVPDLNDNITIDSGSVTIQGATNALAKSLRVLEEGNLVVLGTLTLYGGSSYGLQVLGNVDNLGGDISITKVLSGEGIWIFEPGRLFNDGTITIDSTWYEFIDNRNFLHNSVNGTITGTNMMTFSLIGDGIYNSDTLINEGTITLSDMFDSGIYCWDGSVFTNSGTINLLGPIIESGIELWGTTMDNSGVIHIESAANNGTFYAGLKLWFSATATNSGTIHFTDDIKGDGIFLDNTSSFTNTSSGELNISILGCSCGGAVGIDNSGEFTNEGTINVVEGTGFTGYYALENKNGGIFSNSGTLNFEASLQTRVVNFGTGTQILNSGTILIPEYPGGFFGSLINTSEAEVVNDGTITITNDAGTINDGNAVFTNNGTLHSAYGITNYAVFTNSSSGTIQIDTFHLLNSTNFSVTSTGDFTNQGTILVQNGFYGIQNDRDASFDNQGSIDISQTSYHGLSNDAFGGTWNNTYFENSGSITIDIVSGRGINNFGDPEFLNSGTITISNTGQEGLFNSYEAACLFSNSGMINIGPDIGTAGNYSAIYNSAPFTNEPAGVLNISTSTKHGIEMWNYSFTNGGTILINTSIPQSGIKLRTGAVLENQSGAELTVNDCSGEGIYLDAGTVNNGGKITFETNIGADAILGPTGTFTNQGTGELWGTGTIDGGVFTNQGSLNPGFSPGDFTIITAPYDHTNGTFNLEIAGTAGPAQPNGHDQLIINPGTATLGGTLNITLINGFTPSVGQSWVIVDCPSGYSGTFTNVTYPIDPAHWSITYDPTEVILNYEGEPLVATASDDVTICDGETTTISASGTGGGGNYNFFWDNGLGNGQSHDVAPNTTTVYRVTVSDNFGHASSDSVTVTVLASPTAVITGDMEICPGDTTVLDAGSFSSYLWSTNATTQTIQVTAAGNYSVTVTNANDCTDDTLVTVTVYPDVSPQITGDLEICPGATTTLDAGTFDSYLWSTNETTQSISVGVAGTFTVTVMDGNACTGTDEVVVTENTPPAPSIAGDPDFCAGTSTTLDAGGFDSYLWSTNETTQTISVASSGNYSVTVTDANGCTGTTSISVSENPLPTPSIAGDTDYCEGETTSLDAGSFDSYLWSTNETTQIITPASPGGYSVTVTDANGCTGTDMVTVTEFPAPQPAISGDQDFCTGTSTTLDAGSFASWLWSTNETTQSISVNTAGTYTVTVTDANSCTGTDEVSVTEVTPPAPSITGDPDFCAGASTTLDAGSFDSYLWSTNETTQTITVATSGNYSVTVTDVNGCTGTSNIIVNEVPLPTPAIAGDTDYCEGETTTLDAGSFDSYLWSTNETTQMITPASPGGYSVTVTDANGCTGTDMVTVTEFPAPQPAISGDLDFCTGTSTTLDAGSFASYLWSTNETTQSISVNTAGTYTVTVTDANSCTGTDEVSVNEVTPPAPSITGDPDFCAGASTTLDAGSFDSYLWSTNETTQTISVTASGSYSVTVTDVNGCTGTSSISVNEVPLPTPSIAGDTDYCEGETTTLDAGSFDSYLWSTNETTQVITPASPGGYSVTVTDANGCTGTDAVTVTEFPTPQPAISGDLDFCTGTSTTLDAGSFASYLWSTNETTQSISVNTAGTYTVTVTDANSCTGTDEVSVTEVTPPAPSITGDPDFCAGASTTLDAGAFDSYLWSTNATTQTITVSAGGSYSVTVTDVSGCTGTSSITVTEVPLPTPVIAGDLQFCAGESTTLDAGNYTSYLWSTNETTQTISASIQGSYGVTVTDANGCTGTDAVIVSELPDPIPVISGNPEFCSGGSTTLDAGTFNAYLWSTNETTQIINVSSAGTYSVTVTDGNGCTGTQEIVVNALPLPSPVISGNPEFCPGESTTLDAGSYAAYLWSTNATTQTITVSSAGTYSVTVTDANGCTGTQNIDVEELIPPTPAITGIPEFCPGESTTLDAGVFSAYLWSTNETTQTIDVASAGSYSVTVTDVNGCTGTASVTVMSLTPPAPSITGDPDICPGETTTLDAGSSFSSYLWSTSETTQTITTSDPGTYIVTVTDANGCTGSASITVNTLTPPDPVISGDPDICTGEATLLDAGTYSSYLWSTNETTQTIPVSTGGTFTVTVTDANGCSGTDDFEVTEFSPPDPAISGNPEFCSGSTTTLDAGSFSAYLWSTNASTQTIDVSAPGTYEVTVTDGNGCTGTSSIDVVENPLPTPVITGILDFCDGESTTLSIAAFDEILWSTGETGTSIVVDASGDYGITVTDGNGCTGTDEVAITEYLPVEPEITGQLSLCFGNETTLDAGSYSSFLWSTGESTQTITVSDAGVYSVTVTDANGCTGTDGVTVTVSESLEPMIEAPPLLCSGETVELDAGVFFSYLWSTNATTQTILVDAPGTYSVTVTDQGGCSGEDAILLSEVPSPTPEIVGQLEFCEGTSTTLEVEGFYTTYDWSSNQQGPLITVQFPGEYTVTVTDDNGCTGTDFATVSTIPAPQPEISGDTTLCAGQSTILDAGTFDSYLWSTGETTQMISTSQGGTFAVTVSLANACTGVDSVTVSESAPLTPQITGMTSFCEGDSTSLDAGIFTGYAWSTGESTQTITVSEPGMYMVTVFDPEGCEGSDSVNIEVNPELMPEIEGQLSFCSGGSTTLNAGIFNSYLWSTGANTQMITVTDAGDYTVTVTDANGCTGSDQVTVTESAELMPEITGQFSFCSGDSTVLDAGTFDTYTWSTGETTQTISVTEAGTYSVTVADLSGCEGTDAVTVEENDVLTPVIQGDPEICEGEMSDLDAGVYTSYIWSTGETTQVISVSAAGTYTVTVSDASGCEGIDAFEVNVFPEPEPAITGDLTFCSGDSTTLDAGTFDTYLWSTGATTQTITVQSTGTFSVTVTNTSGCAGNNQVSVTEQAELMPQITGQFSFCTGDSSALDAGVFETYAWSTGAGTQSITVYDPGIYTVTVSDALGCLGTDAVIINVNDELQPQITGDLTLCSGDTTVLDAGTFDSYLWSTGESTRTITVDASGTYSVTVGDQSGCEGDASVDVVVFDTPQPAITGPAAICEGDSSFLEAGIFTSYQWSTGESTPGIHVTAPGSYQVTVTDINGCQGSDEFLLAVFDAPQPDIQGQLSFCTGDSTILDAGTYQAYQWSTGATGQVISATEAGEYSVTVSDANGCTGTDQVTVTESTELSPQITGELSLCAGDSTSLDAGVFDQYLWSTGESGREITVTVAGTYSVTVSDLNGCEGSATVEVELGTSLAPEIIGDLEVCAGNSTTLDAGVFDHYLWSNGDTTATITVNIPGEYSVTVNNETGCPGSDAVTLVVYPEPQAEITGQTSFCTGSSTSLDAGIFDVYLWSTGATSQEIQVDQSGTYSVTVTDANGCQAADTVEVTESSELIPTITGVFSFCQGGSTTLDAGVFDDYLWSTGSFSRVIDVSEPGIYSVTVSDLSGCSGDAQVTVTELPAPDPGITGSTSICTGGETVLDAGTWSDYTWSTGQTSPTILVTTQGEYSVTVTDANGCTGTAAVEVTESQELLPNISGDATFCSGESTLLDAGSWAGYLWSTGDETQSITVNEPGLYTVTVFDASGCQGEDAVDVMEQPLPDPQLSDMYGICTGETLTLDPGDFEIYIWSTGASSPSIQVADQGAFAVTVIDNFGCEGDASTVVEVYPLPDVNAGDDIVLSAGESVQLLATGAETYTWLVSDYLSCTMCPDPLATPEETLGYIVEGQDANGCTNTDSLTITVLRDMDEMLDPVNTITPNGDGVNDYFYIRGIENYEEPKLTIFNRWGDEIYQSLDYQNDWNGTYKGQPVPAGTYLYSLAIQDGDQKIILRNTITVIRE